VGTILSTSSCWSSPEDQIDDIDGVDRARMKGQQHDYITSTKDKDEAISVSG
jgi:hypothetical protein